MKDVPGGLVFLIDVGPVDYDTMPLDEFDLTSRLKGIFDEERNHQPPVAIPGLEANYFRVRHSPPIKVSVGILFPII